MFNPQTIVTQVAAQQIAHCIDRLVGTGDDSAVNLMHAQLKTLREIAEAINPAVTPNVNIGVVLQPYPSEYILTDEHRPHISMFAPTSGMELRFDVPGTGSYEVTLNNGGWFQVDLPPATRISTTDTNTYNVIFSHRDDPIGVAI